MNQAINVRVYSQSVPIFREQNLLFDNLQLNRLSALILFFFPPFHHFSIICNPFCLQFLITHHDLISCYLNSVFLREPRSPKFRYEVFWSKNKNYSGVHHQTATEINMMKIIFLSVKQEFAKSTACCEITQEPWKRVETAIFLDDLGYIVFISSEMIPILDLLSFHFPPR